MGNRKRRVISISNLKKCKNRASQGRKNEVRMAVKSE